MNPKFFGLAAAAIALLNPSVSYADLLPFPGLPGYTFTTFDVPGQQLGGTTHLEGINDQGELVGVASGPVGFFLQPRQL
jgi:hypothetical protein